jgi:hypothetical protein
MMTTPILKTLLLGAMLATASTASAVVVTALPGGTAIPIPGINTATNSSDAIGGGITFTSNVPGGSILGKTSETTFGNGTFEAGNPYLSLEVAANGYNYATMTLTFDTPTSGFLADIRWTDGGPGIGNLGYNSAGIGAFNANGDLIEYLPFNNNGNADPFHPHPPGTYGFLRPTADIVRITFNNAFMGARDLQYIGPAIGGSSAAPDAATWLMSIAGFGLLGGILRRRGGSAATHRLA